MSQIREAKEADLGIINRLAHATWPDAYGKIISPGQLNYMLELIYSEAALTNQIKNLRHKFIIIYDKSDPVGFASFSLKNATDLTLYRLHKLYVLPNQQGKGTGGCLTTYIVDEIKKTGASVLELNVNRHNSAVSFYKKKGFVVVREEDIDIGNGYFMNDYVMQLRIVKPVTFN